jgi:ribosomal protein S18 acetylase RimI-like enzyme
MLWLSPVVRAVLLPGGFFMIRCYLPSDDAALLQLWNTAGVCSGYAPLDMEKFRRLFLAHPEFSAGYTFVLEEQGRVLGFVSGCAGDHIADGSPTGYISCLILETQADTAENTALLIGALEEAFRKAGRTHSVVSYFNPIRLPWIIPGTEGHQHNNMPGIPVELPLYERLCSLGYGEMNRECALYYDLANHTTPEWVEEKAAKMADRGYTVARYDPSVHQGLEEMVESLHNSMWSAEIPAAGRAGMDLLVGLKGNVCAGFTGPVYPEETGRGYLAGVAVAPMYEGNGLGTLLFYRLLQREKEVGSRYMSIFTEVNNRARFIYLTAGFRIVRIFAVMRKAL